MSFERRLLKLVSLNQLIFDNKHPDYDNRPKRKEVWNRIATVLNSNPESCKKRWISLRATYRKLLHRIKSEGGPEKYNKKWKYYDDIAFINKFDCMTSLVSWDENSFESNSQNPDNTEDSAKSSSRNFENCLLDSVRRHEVLYNPNHSGYSDADERNFAWHNIAKELKVEKSTLKIKWHSLRSAYNKILRKINAIGGMSNYKRKWIYFDKMSFLNPFIPRLLPSDLVQQESFPKSHTSYEVAQTYKEEPIDMFGSHTSPHYDDEEYADDPENSIEIEQSATAEMLPSIISSTVEDFENSLEYKEQEELDEQELLELEEEEIGTAHQEYDDDSNSLAFPTPAKKCCINNKRKATESAETSTSGGPCTTYFALLGSKIDETKVPPSERYKLEKRVTDLVYGVLEKYS